MSQFWNDIKDFFEKSGYRFIQILIIFIAGFIVIKLLMALVRRIFLRSRLDGSVLNFTLSIVQFILVLILLLICIGMLNISLTPLITLLATFGVALGLALQDIIANILNGMVLAGMKPFKVGDFVEIGSIKGRVKEIKLTSTIFTTLDNRTIIYPNKKIFGSEIINHSANKIRRIDKTFTVSSDNNIDRVKSVIADTVAAYPFVLKTHEPFIKLMEMGNSILTFEVRVWANTDDYWEVLFNLAELIIRAFTENGIAFPSDSCSVSISGAMAKEEAEAGFDKKTGGSR